MQSLEFEAGARGGTSQKVQQMAQWLTIVSWVAVILGLLAAVARSVAHLTSGLTEDVVRVTS